MKTLKLKFVTVSLLAIFSLTIVIQSCTQKEIVPQPETEITNLNFESTTIELTQDDPIILALKASEDLQHYNEAAGELLWDMASMVTYDSEQTLPLIMIPIDNGGEETLSMFVSAYNQEKGEFYSFLNNFDLSQIATTEEDGYTGTIEFKTVENLSVQSTIYEKGSVMQVQDFEISELAYRGVSVRCFLDCMKPFGITNQLLAVAGFCGASASCCLGFVSPWNPCCVSVAGCALWYGGVAGYCAWQCWD